MAASHAAVFRAARKSAGLSVARASLLLGVSCSTVKRWERGLCLPSLNESQKLLMAMGHGEASVFHTSLENVRLRHWEHQDGSKCWPVLRLLRSRRRRNGSSLADIAAVTGQSVASLHRYETGARTPQPEQLARLCQAYGLTEPERQGVADVLAGGHTGHTFEPETQFLSPDPAAHVRVFAFIHTIHRPKDDQCRSVSALVSAMFSMGDQVSLAEIWPMLRRLLPDPQEWPIELRTSCQLLKVSAMKEAPSPKAADKLRGEVLRAEPGPGQLSSVLNLCRISAMAGRWAVARDWLEFADELCVKFGDDGSSHLVDVNRAAVDFGQSPSRADYARVQAVANRPVTGLHRYIAQVALAQCASRVGDEEGLESAMETCAELEALYGFGSPTIRSLRHQAEAAG